LNFPTGFHYFELHFYIYCSILFEKVAKNTDVHYIIYIPKKLEIAAFIFSVELFGYENNFKI